MFSDLNPANTNSESGQNGFSLNVGQSLNLTGNKFYAFLCNLDNNAV